MARKLETLDDYLNSTDVLSSNEIEILEEKRKQKKINVSNKSKIKTLNSNPINNDFEVSEKASVMLSKNAKSKLEMYLKRSTPYKILNSQIDILNVEFENYKKIGETELAEKTKLLLSDLTQKRTKYTKLYKKKLNPESDDKIKNDIKNSDKIKVLNERLEFLKSQYTKINPNSIIHEVIKYRKYLGIDKYNISEPLDTDVDDFDEYINTETDSKETKLNLFQQQYSNLCGDIADMLDLTVDEILQMPTAKIQKLLSKNKDSEKIGSITAEINQIKFDIASEINVLKGFEEITNVIYEIFDFEDAPENEPKDMLASANVEYVKSCAYNACKKINGLEHIEDAIAYGLMGLSLAINKWYKIQKLKDSAVSFQGFASIYIMGEIQKGLLELGSGGTINKSSIASNLHYRKKQMEAFMELNPDLRDLPQEIIETIIDFKEEKPASVITEGTYSAIVGGEDENADIWANVSVSDDDKFIYAKAEYEDFLKSLKVLFSLFETKVDKKTGIREITQKKLFDKFDYKLFKLALGLECKQEIIDGKLTKIAYTQEEMGTILSQYYASFGSTNMSFSQPAIKYRLTQIWEKIKKAISEYPSIKTGFEYLINYAGTEINNVLSDNREEIISKIENSTENFKSENSEKLSDLKSGKKLNIDISDSNLLDEEIANYFTNLF